MKLLAVALLLLPLSACWAEVVGDFIVSCPQFFFTQNGVVHPPTRFINQNNQNRYQQICQTLNGQIEFATFYDTMHKIPVYSAYRFSGAGQCNRLGGWYIEPQLDDASQGGNMTKDSNNSFPSLGTNQARNGDYAKSGYHKGHLAPVSHQNSQSCANATFTLTNAAPQNSSFNSGQWRVAELNMSKVLQSSCGPVAYIVTGVVPGNTALNNRVQIPSHFWSAYCCLDNNQRIHSGGFIGSNYANNPVQYLNRQNLEGQLSTLYNQNFALFVGSLC